MAQPVTPNPLPPITPGGVAVGIDDFVAPPRTSGSPPFARLNTLFHADDGTDRLFAADNRGKIWVIEDGAVRAQPFLDLRTTQAGGTLIDGNPEQGLRSFAFHPDFERPGTAGYGRVYTMATETVVTGNGTRVFADSTGNAPVAHDVLVEWRVDPNNPNRIDPASRREVLRIEEAFSNHNTDQVLFNPNARPGDADHGKLYIGTGDGGGGGDPLRHAQDPGRAQGKILRIDPLEQANGADYATPGDNPFVGRPGYLPEVWALGLRHPQNLSFDTGGRGQLLVTDIGQANIEEVNLGLRGGNYGWQDREGTFATAPGTSDLFPLPSSDRPADPNLPGYAYPVAQYDHDEGAAIAGGFVYRGTAIPQLYGQYLFGDIANGRVFHVPVDRLRPGAQAPIKELTFLVDDRVVTMRDLVGGSRVDLRFGEGPDGELYVMSKQDGEIRRLESLGGPGFAGTNGNDNLGGTGGGDTINVRGGDDRAAGRDGNDRLFGEAGRDLLYGDVGNDLVIGDSGDDVLYGGAGLDRAFGGAGLDRLYGDDGDDDLRGEAGADRLFGGAGSDRIEGGADADTIVIGGPAPGADAVLGFVRGEDLLRLETVRGSGGGPVARFADLDSNGDRVLNDADAAVTVQGGALTLLFDGGRATLAGVTELTAANLSIAYAGG